MKRPHFIHLLNISGTPPLAPNPALRATLSARAAFTLIELLTVMAIIAVLAGLILKGAGYAQNKAARDKAAAEIAAISVALESYKADNGEYPVAYAAKGPNDTPPAGTPPKALTSVNSNAAPTAYVAASTVLQQNLSDKDRVARIYFEAKPDILSTGTAARTDATHFIDPFGNSYGYAVHNGNTTNSNTYNPTFDLWSTAGQTGGTAATQKQDRWIKNW